jgi:predicted MFS family arabinose efflux permease
MGIDKPHDFKDAYKLWLKAAKGNQQRAHFFSFSYLALFANNLYQKSASGMSFLMLQSGVLAQ